MRKALPSIVAVFVAVSVAWAAASYPTSVKVFTTKAQNETIQPAHMNDVQDEITAIEQGLLNGFAHTLKPSTDGGQALGTSALRWKNLSLFLGTLTDQLAAIDIAGTWNDAADTFTLIKANITDPASAAASLFVDFQIGGVSKFKVDKTGQVTTTGAVVLPADPTTALQAATKQYVDAGLFVDKLDADVVSQTVNNTTAETIVYSFSVPGGTLGTNNGLRLVLLGELLNNDVNTNDFTIRAKYGGSALGGVQVVDLDVSVARRPVRLEVTLHAQNATNAQTGSVMVIVGKLAGGVAGGDQVYIEGAVDVTASVPGIAMNNALALDSTAAQTLSVTVLLSAASTNFEFVARSVYLEVIK